MTEIGSRGKIGLGHSKPGSKSGCVISETDTTYINQKTDLALRWSWCGIPNTTKRKPRRRIAFKEIGMECQRCLTGKEAKYRIYSDIIDMKVCAACADETRRLGLDLPLNLLRTGSKKQRICLHRPRLDLASS